MGRLRIKGPGRCGLGLLCCLLIIASAPAPQEGPSAEVYRGRLCFTTVVKDPEAAAATIAGSAEPGQEIFATGDDLFVDAPAGSLRAGEGMLAYRLGVDVKHPGTGENLGTSVFLAAYVTVLQAHGERAVVHVNFSCAELERGDMLRPLHTDDIAEPGEPPALGLPQLVEPSADDATLVFGSGEAVSIGGKDARHANPVDRVSYTIGDVVTLDRGSAAGWTPGTWGTVYVDPEMARRYGESSRVVDQLVAAQGYVLWATPDTAAFMIAEARGGVEIGMRVRRR